MTPGSVALQHDRVCETTEKCLCRKGRLSDDASILTNSRYHPQRDDPRRLPRSAVITTAATVVGRHTTSEQHHGMVGGRAQMKHRAVATMQQLS